MILIRYCFDYCTVQYRFPSGCGFIFKFVINSRNYYDSKEHNICHSVVRKCGEVRWLLDALCNTELLFDLMESDFVNSAHGIIVAFH